MDRKECKIISYNSFNPYCYWSYLLTKEKKVNIKIVKNEKFQSLLLLVLSFNIDKAMEKGQNFGLGFNPYCYWSYLLTKIKYDNI